TSGDQQQEETEPESHTPGPARVGEDPAAITQQETHDPTTNPVRTNPGPIRARRPGGGKGRGAFRPPAGLFLFFVHRRLRPGRMKPERIRVPVVSGGPVGSRLPERTPLPRSTRGAPPRGRPLREGCIHDAGG